MTVARRTLARQGVDRAAHAASVTFQAAARLRGGVKPLHPRGVVLAGAIARHGSPQQWGSAWLDEPGEDPCTVRISRSAGLPPPLPDVVGISMRIATAEGPADLLLASAGLGVGVRHLLAPRRDALVTATTLLPYRSRRGLVMIGAWPLDDRLVPLNDKALAGAGELRFALAAATPGGRWQRFGTLVAEGLADRSQPDPPLDLDPVLNPLPGLVLPEPVASVRAAAYAGARRGRRTG